MMASFHNPNNKWYYLWRDYCFELNQYSSYPRNRFQIQQAFADMTDNPFIDIILIREEFKDDPVGFLAVGHGEECHSHADIFIADAYIDKKYRGLGLMMKTLIEFHKDKIEELGRPPIYCQFIFDKNIKALSFWKYFFLDVINYTNYDLKYKYNGTEEYQHYGWCKKKG